MHGVENEHGKSILLDLLGPRKPSGTVVTLSGMYLSLIYA